MFVLNDDLSIYATRGDIVFFSVTAEDSITKEKYIFQAGDVVRIKIYGRKEVENVVLQKDFPVLETGESVDIFLSEEDTKIGEVISKPNDYWYEVELNPFTNPQTIIGYDEDGAKVFKLFPEGDDIPPVVVPEPEDIPVVDGELDLTSDRPVENRTIARAIVNLESEVSANKEASVAKDNQLHARMNDIAESVAMEQARLDIIISGATIEPDAEIADVRVGADGVTYASAGTAVRSQNNDLAGATMPFANYVMYDHPYLDNEAHLKYNPTTNVYTAYIPALLIVSGKKHINEPATELSFEQIGNYNLYLLCYNFNISGYEVKYWLDFISLADKKSYVVVGTIGLAELYLHIHANSQKPDRYLPFVSVITGSSINRVANPIPIVDTTSRTLTFPTDTIFRMDSAYVPYFTLNESEGNTVCDFSNLTTSAVNIVFDTVTRKMYPVSYADKNVEIDGEMVAVVYPRFYMVCTIRTTNRVISCTFPYICDGYFMGTRLYDFVRNDVESCLSSYRQLYSGYHAVKSVNHRGYNTEAPENTLSAFRLSKRKGFKYVECDVSFTSDGVPVLLHDSTVDRTSNGTGKINEMTFEQVRALDFGSWFSEEYAGEKIPSFEEFISLCRNLGLHPYIEIKTSEISYTNAEIEQLIGIVKRYGMADKVTWISFSGDYLNEVKNCAPHARLGLVVMNLTDYLISLASSLKTESNDVFIDAYAPTLEKDQVAKCLDADIPVEVWTVNDMATLKSLDPYISGVTSDNLDAALTLMESNI